MVLWLVVPVLLGVVAGTVVSGWGTVLVSGLVVETVSGLVVETELVLGTVVVFVAGGG